VRSEVLGCWGGTEGEPGALEAYRGKLERLMRFEGDPDAGRRGEFEAQVKRGWYIGSAEFREKLLEKLQSMAGGDNFRSSQKREHNEAVAERLLAIALLELDVSEEALLAMKSNRLEKQALAWLLKSETTVTGEWLSSCLRPGHASNCSRALKRFREGRDPAIEELTRRLGKSQG
jgi:hypothetical protein